MGSQLLLYISVLVFCTIVRESLTVSGRELPLKIREREEQIEC